MTCDETQVINEEPAARKRSTVRSRGRRRPGPRHANETNAFWFSDFDGAPAVKFNIVITPSGNFEGWAIY